MGCVNDRLFTIRRGDTLPRLRLLLADADGNIPDLTGATGLLELWKGTQSTPTVTGVPTLFTTLQEDESGDLYNCEYAWILADTDRLPVSLRGEVEVTFPGGGVATFPSRRQDRFTVQFEAD